MTDYELLGGKVGSIIFPLIIIGLGIYYGWKHSKKREDPKPKKEVEEMRNYFNKN